MLRETLALMHKELLLEWRQRYALNGLLLYVLSMVVSVTTAFAGRIHPELWSALFWVMMLFVAVTSVARSFMAEQPGQMLYLYTLARPEAIVLAKILYYGLLLWLVSGVTLAVYAFLGEIPVASPLRMAGLLLGGGFALASTLTLVSAIASKAENRTTLLAVLSFPLLMPALLTLIRLTQTELRGLSGSSDASGVLLLAGISAALTGASVVLFPFVWRD
ncbi:MAG: heme exporter protein CcmB [Bacteroidia bacterium]|nr:heme exporter protein CcmB [Bacteroidia bacterium]